MPYCPKCGKEVSSTATYCTSCGAHLDETTTEEFSVSAEKLIGTVKKLIREGNVTRIIVKDGKGKTLLDIPAAIGVVGAVLAPWMAALGVITSLATKCTIAVERRPK
ncbi:MAG: DUF4342 domain-containing protein [Nitrososphaeria archaeon]